MEQGFFDEFDNDLRDPDEDALAALAALDEMDRRAKGVDFTTDSL